MGNIPQPGYHRARGYAPHRGYTARPGYPRGPYGPPPRRRSSAGLWITLAVGGGFALLLFVAFLGAVAADTDPDPTAAPTPIVTDPTPTTEPSTTEPPTTETTPVSTSPYEMPPTHGDDPQLDALWDECAGGDPLACDQLYEQAPEGSGYQTFGADCGGRQPDGTLWCVDFEGVGALEFADLGTLPLLTTSTGVAGPGCNLAPMGYDTASIRANWTSAVECLGDRWEETLTGLEIPYRDPGLVIVENASNAESPCGQNYAGAPAFYCGSNETIYLLMDNMNVDDGWPMEAYLETVAHEFGHHVQHLSGILAAEWEHRFEVGPDTSEGELSARRTELQASCFGGMWLGSQNYYGVLFAGDLGFNYYLEWWTFYGDPIHGSEASIEDWLSAGYFSNRTPSCNTFAASPGEVSY